MTLRCTVAGGCSDLGGPCPSCEDDNATQTVPEPRTDMPSVRWRNALAPDDQSMGADLPLASVVSGARPRDKNAAGAA